MNTTGCVEITQACEICGYSLTAEELEEQENSNVKICLNCVEKQDKARYGKKNQDTPRVYQNG